MFFLSNCKGSFREKEWTVTVTWNKWEEMQDHVATYLDSVSDWIYEAEIST